MDPSILATTSTLTPTTLANLSHNSRVPPVHPPSRATTEEMLFRATTQGIPCAYPYPEPQLKGYIPSSTQGTPAIPFLKHHQKPCRSRLQNKQPKVAAAKSPSGGHVPLGNTDFQTTWRGTCTSRRQAPMNHQVLQLLLGGTAHTARRTHSIDH